MTFKLDHHNKILKILQNLDSDILRDDVTYFGGGTLLTINFGEYRWSKDVDFICPVPSPGYKHLRTVVFDGGYKVFRQGKIIENSVFLVFRSIILKFPRLLMVLIF
jgi:hypothetical protein